VDTHWWCFLLAGDISAPRHACNDATVEAAGTASGEGPSFGGCACLGVAACVWASSFGGCACFGVAACVWASSFGGGACFGVAACVWASSFGDSACFGVGASVRASAQGVTTFTDFGGVYANAVSIADASIDDASVSVVCNCVGASFARGGSCA
jgi:hypothetical protein